MLASPGPALVGRPGLGQSTGWATLQVGPPYHQARPLLSANPCLTRAGDLALPLLPHSCVSHRPIPPLPPAPPTCGEDRARGLTPHGSCPEAAARSQRPALRPHSALPLGWHGARAGPCPSRGQEPAIAARGGSLLEGAGPLLGGSPQGGLPLGGATFHRAARPQLGGGAGVIGDGDRPEAAHATTQV